ncbi:MAG: hypothetical protein ABIF12_03975 [bacterium]
MSAGLLKILMCFILLFNISNFSLLIAQDEVQSVAEPQNEEESEFQGMSKSTDILSEMDSAEKDVSQAAQEKARESSQEQSGQNETEELQKFGTVEEPAEPIQKSENSDLKKEGDVIAVESAPESTDKFDDKIETLESAESEEVVEVKKEFESEINPTEKIDSLEENVELVIKEGEKSGGLEPEEKTKEVESLEQEKPVEPAVAIVGVEKEDVSQMVDTPVAAEKLEDVLKKSKNAGKEINDIVDKLREIRNKLHENYHNEVDKNLDNLLQNIGFENGAATGKERFSLLNSAVKKGFEEEWEKIKIEIDAIDSLENQILEKLKFLDQKYEDAIQLSIESRKLNIDVFNVADVNKLQDVLSRLETKKLEVEGVAQEITQKIEKELNELINKTTEKLKSIEIDFNALAEKGKTLDTYEKTLETAKETTQDAAEKMVKEKGPKWRQVIDGAVDRVLDYSVVVVDKVKDVWNYTYSKVKSFLGTFISDVKEKSKKLKEDKETLKSTDAVQDKQEEDSNVSEEISVDIQAEIPSDNGSEGSVSES